MKILISNALLMEISSSWVFLKNMSWGIDLVAEKDMKRQWKEKK